MFVNAMLITYKCPKCGHSERIKRYVQPTLITEALSKAVSSDGTPKICYNCRYGAPLMNIIEVQCVPMYGLDEFGVGRGGYWKCKNPDHFSKDNTVYPIPLQKVYSKELQLSNNIYQKIINIGYPWRCPTCKEKLHFETTF